MTNPNEPVFSTKILSETVDGKVYVGGHCEGLTKREYFAGMMQKNAPQIVGPEDNQARSMRIEWARNVCLNADALITQLNKEPKNET